MGYMAITLFQSSYKIKDICYFLYIFLVVQRHNLIPKF